MTLKIALCLAIALLLASQILGDPFPSPYDHGKAEINAEKAPTVAPRVNPIVHQKYYRGERELFGYNPPSLPTGGVAFGLENRPYIRASDPSAIRVFPGLSM